MVSATSTNMVELELVRDVSHSEVEVLYTPTPVVALVSSQSCVVPTI